MFCHRFSLTFINPRSSTALTVDASPSPVAGEALAPQPAEGRTELIPLATMGHLNPEFCPAPCSYSHHAEPSEDPEGFFLPVCSHQTPPMSSQPKKRAFSFTAPIPGPPHATLAALRREEGAGAAGAAPGSAAPPAEFRRFGNICKPPRQHPSPHIKFIYGVRNTQGRGRIPGL